MTIKSARAESQALEDRVAEAAGRHQVPGVAVGIWDGNVETYVCHGVTSVENPLAIDERTLFQIGSTGKTYTATALLRLVEQGQVDLAAPVREYLPAFQVSDEQVAAKVTVLQLLNHTAGWRGDYFADTGQGEDAIEKFIATMASLEQTHPLGEGASYNNSAVCTAGRVIEVVTGKSFETAVRELVLEPLGLGETFYFVADAITRRTAIGHFNSPQGPQVVRAFMMPRSAAPAGAGIMSSVRDQIAYARFHLGTGVADNGERVLSPETLRRMQQPTASLEPGSALGEAVGIPWLLSTISGERIVAHGGATLGLKSDFKLVPGRDFAFTVLTNSNNGGKLHTELAEWILETYLGLADPILEPLALSIDQLTEYTGVYDQDGILHTISVDRDHLVMATEFSAEARQEMEAALGVVPPDEPPMPFAVVDQDRFVEWGRPARRAEGRFVRDHDGRVTAMDSGGRLAHRI